MVFRTLDVMRIPALLLGLVLAGCGGSPSLLPPDTPDVAALRLSCGPDLSLVGSGLPEQRDGFAGAAAVLVVDGWRPPPLRLSEVQQQGLRDFVQRGGRLLLLGYAARLVYDLGFEARPPDVYAPFSWGFDSDTAIGQSQLGFLLVSGRVPELMAGLQHADDGEHVYRFAGGIGVQLPQCLWSGYEPQNGEVLGRLSVRRDGGVEVSQQVALAQWHVGRGAVLACGLVPEVDNDDAVLAANARRWLANAVRWLGGDQPPAQVALWQLPAAPLPPAPAPMPPLLQRQLPAAPLLAHWGWEVAATTGHDFDEPLRAQEILDDVLLPSWRGGADLLAVEPWDQKRGLPLPWSKGDALRPPEGYRGGDFWPEWDARAFALLATEAHARGMLVEALLPQLLVQDGSVAAQLAALRFVARELCDRRGLGTAAWDGLSLQRWFDDRSGYGLSMLQDLQPGGFLQYLGRDGRCGGAVAALDAEWGRPQGLGAAGISRQWRDGFPGDLFPVGRLDCRALPADVRRWGQSGGGSSGDWIVTQCNDFVRARLGQGASLYWRAFNPATMTADTAAYVQGISQDPLRAAVAVRCLATGVGGWRDGERQLLPSVQQGFGSEVPTPAATCYLQNNHVRLYGSGGALLWDPQGLARFAAGEVVVLSKEWMHTRLFGGRPSADEARIAALDLYGGGSRPAGGYHRQLRIGAGTTSLPPALLAAGQAPEWPEQVHFDIDLPPGYYELELRLRPVQEASLVLLSLDGEPLQCLAVPAGAPAVEPALPLHLVEAGIRTLSLHCVRGGSVAIDRLRLHRQGDLAAEADVTLPAGAMASLRERSNSSYFSEAAKLCTAGDLAGFLWSSECTRAVRNLQMERSFSLSRHVRLVRSSAGEPEHALRAPFVLGGDGPGLPELAVVPLQLSRYDHFELRDGGLVLVGAPEPGTRTAVGFLLLRNGEGAALGWLPRLFAALDRPQVLDLSGGEAALQSDLPFAWTRVVQLHQQGRTPYLVCERGWWTWRGAQPGPDGGDLLRIVHTPGDTVQILGGPALLARTRPGPGALHTVALRDVEADALTARVLMPSPLQPPSVVMAADFDEAFVDGRPWCYRDGRTIYLPAQPGSYRIEVRRHGGLPTPCLLATRADLQECAYDPAQKELVFLARAGDDRPQGLPLVALLSGPVPRSIDGGEVIAESELRYSDAALAAAAARRGVLIRFRPGLVRVQYGD